MAPDDERLLEVAARLGPRLAGVMTHGGHSYAGRHPTELAGIAEQERSAVVAAAERLRQAGHTVGIVSLGSSPTALHAEHLDGVTEVRAGVYMFGDLFQAEILTHAQEDIAVTVLATVIGLREAEHKLVLDAGGLALSKDRSTQATDHDYGFGLVLAEDGSPRLGRSIVRFAYQEHGVVDCDPGLPFPMLRVGDQVRVAPNHTCMTAAAYDRYHVVAGTSRVRRRVGPGERLVATRRAPAPGRPPPRRGRCPCTAARPAGSPQPGSAPGPADGGRSGSRTAPA